MSNLSAIPGYIQANAEYQALKQQADSLVNQRDAAAREFGIESVQAQQYQQQASALEPQLTAANQRVQDIILAPTDPNLASPTVTIVQSQSTPAANSREDGLTQVPTLPGVGAGTGSNADNSRGNDNSPPSSRSSNQQAINTAFANQAITSRPNVLDQYASYTYAISWWLLTPEQYNSLGAGRNRAPAPGTGNWTLLIQSGGAPTAGRNPAFPDDFYFDDLEIETFIMGKGTNMSNNAMSIRFKIVEPNGLTLLERLYNAVTVLYKNQTAQKPNYVAAQYCLTVEFYGYDGQGNLIAPATGSTGNGLQAVIKKYYPFLLKNITFRTVANQVEYLIEGIPVPYDTGTAQARGTIPYAFQLAGTTVSSLLQGGPLPITAGIVDGRPGESGQLDRVLSNAAITDASQAQVNDNGNFTGESTSPFNVGP